MWTFRILWWAQVLPIIFYDELRQSESVMSNGDTCYGLVLQCLYAYMILIFDIRLYEESRRFLSFGTAREGFANLYTYNIPAFFVFQSFPFRLTRSWLIEQSIHLSIHVHFQLIHAIILSFTHSLSFIYLIISGTIDSLIISLSN